MRKLQISLTTLIYGALAVQICMIMYRLLDCGPDNPAGWLVLTGVIYALGVGGLVCLSFDQSRRRRRLLRSGRCPHCEEIADVAGSRACSSCGKKPDPADRTPTLR